MRQAQVTADDILFSNFDLDMLGLSESGSPGETWLRPDAGQAWLRSVQLQSLADIAEDDDTPTDWLDAEPQDEDIDPEEDDPEEDDDSEEDEPE